MTFDSRLIDEVARHPYTLLFATISGAHLYGFPSPDSDFDLRGVHVLPIRSVVGLEEVPDTITHERIVEGMEIDLVTHDVKKFLRMLLKKNGYVLEQLTSPLVVATSPEHQELVALAPACVTRHHAHHYLGFFDTQWKLFAKERPPRVKPLLYVYRVLLTGVHLMRTGRVEANLLRLNEDAKLTLLNELIAQKTTGTEQGTLDAADVEFHERRCHALVEELKEAALRSSLPELPSAGPALHDLLVRVRLASSV